MGQPEGSRLRGISTLAIRRRWWFLAAWILLLAIAVSQSRGLETLLRGSVGVVNGAESGRVERLLARDFPSPYSQFLIVTLEPAAGATSELAPQALRLETALDHLPYVSAVMPIPGQSGSRAALLVGLKASTMKDSEARVKPLRRWLSDVVPPGIRSTVTGQAAFDIDMVAFGNQSAAQAERIVLPLMFVALLLAFGAFGAAGIPLIAGAAAVITSMGGLAVIARHLSLSVYAANVITMLGLGLGVDYSLFVVARVREEQAEHPDPLDAVSVATRHALPAILASAATVIIGLAMLATVPAEDTLGMGIGGVLVAAASALAAATLLPMLAAFLGKWLDAPRFLSARLLQATRPERWSAFATQFLKHPVMLFGVAAAILVVLSLPLRGVVLGDPELTMMPDRIEAVHGFRVLRDMGAAGSMIPFQVVVKAPPGEPILTARRVDGLARLVSDLRGDRHVAQVLALCDPRNGADRLKLGLGLMGETSLRANLPTMARSLLSRDGTATVLYVIVRSDLSYQEARSYGSALKRTDWSRYEGLEGCQVLMGGTVPFANELIDVIRDSGPRVVAFIVLATLLMLFWLTRSWLIPVKAVLANLLTVAGALGATNWLLQSPWACHLLGLASPVQTISPGIPLITFCVIFGLSMDYEVFLISRILEAHRAGASDLEAIARGVGTSGPVITSGAILMAIVFMGFAMTEFIPVKVLGVSLTLGVILDATLVRFALVPSLMRLAGRWNWWPGDRAPRGSGATPAAR